MLTMLGMDGVEGLWWVTNVEHGWRWDCGESPTLDMDGGGGVCVERYQR